MDDNSVDYFSTFLERKASIVERYNRTLKTMIWKYSSKSRLEKWIEVFDDLAYNYNCTKHRSIGMKPVEMMKKNEFDVWGRLYRHLKIGEFLVPKFKIGDVVRISEHKNIF